MKLYTKLAEYYFAIESNHRDITNDISFIRSLKPSLKNPAILDLGCGTGEHLNELSRLGYTCTGIDSSMEMIEIARKRFPGNITFLHSSMTNFDFYENFDFIMSLFGTFNYLIEDSDIEKTLWNIYRALRPEGTGILEIWNTLPIERIGGKGLSHISTTKYGDAVINRNRGFNLLDNPDKTVVEVNYKYITTDQKGSQSIHDKHIMRTFSIDEIRKFLADSGFVIKSIYSNFLEEPYREISSRMIVVFIKD